MFREVEICKYSSSKKYARNFWTAAVLASTRVLAAGHWLLIVISYYCFSSVIHPASLPVTRVSSILGQISRELTRDVSWRMQGSPRVRMCETSRLISSSQFTVLRQSSQRPFRRRHAVLSCCSMKKKHLYIAIHRQRIRRESESSINF